ncbi:hypothetical protein [Thermoproteus tenax]|uniref:Uncharacterized protein n=1 Tax=Thermoproteus tenax (strain ATCC 35583 / DSM 2078 / JCM 9277 / NBRC 100435 / Kra 1) TaxID=768679 RepID=G4RLA4_THETK|nr:hypothetical protein [Thermoproteus tenax]CCC82349.1 hypothetical protein TTX_1728 [Thermoproteus tenax Kra 1]
MEIEVELNRIIIKKNSKRLIGLPLYLNMFGSVKALPVQYLLARYGRVFFEDARARPIARALCEACVSERPAEGFKSVGFREFVEAYYNTIAGEVFSFAQSVDSVAVPCYTGALGAALAKRAREVEPGLTIIAAKLGEGDCGWADAIYVGGGEELGLPAGLNLGPASKASLSAAARASEELGLYSILVLLTDGA